MRSKIIGRKYEQHLLDELYQSKQAEFVVVYGRRRVGKTYLIREMYEGTFTFYHTALSPFDLLSDGELLYRQQLEVFGQSLREYGDYHSEAPKSWLEAFPGSESCWNASRDASALWYFSTNCRGWTLHVQVLPQPSSIFGTDGGQGSAT